MKRLLLLLFLLPNAALALSLYGPGSSTAKMATPASNQILSPDDFAKRVDAINHQTQAAIAQQAKDAIPVVPLKSAPGGANGAPPASPTAATDTASSASPAPAQPYTGFGGSSSTPPINKSSPSSASPNAAGGWNVKY